MVLGKLPVAERPPGLDSGGARAYCACGRYGWVSLVLSIISLLSPSLPSEGPFDPKQPTKYCLISYFSDSTKRNAGVC